MKSLFNLWPFFRVYKRNIIIMAISGLLMSVCQAAIAPVGAYLFERLFSKPINESLPSQQGYLDKLYTSVFGNNPEVLAYAIPLSIVVLYIFNGIFRYTHLYLMRYTGDLAATDLRKKLQEKYLSLNLSFHNNYAQGSGGLLSRTLNDINIIQVSTGIIADYIREPLLAILLLGYMIYTDWLLTLLIFLIVPVLVILLKQLGKSLKKYGHFHQEALEGLTSTLKESLDGVKVIQSFNLEPEQSKKFNISAKKFLATRRKIVAREEISGPISEVIGSLAVAGMAIYFAVKVLHGTSSPGVFMGFVISMGFMQKPIKKIQDAFIKLQQTVVSTDRVMSLLNNDQLVTTDKDSTQFPTEWNQIKFKNISFSYNKETIINNISFNVNKGDVIALVGASGCGKSTLVSLLERFFDPSEGDIYIDNTPIKKIDLISLRQNIGLVTQDVFLFNDTITQNIVYGDINNSNHSNIPNIITAANAAEFIEKFDNKEKTIVGERGNLLSGGEKQRISIARAMFKDAPILILDEATSALDSISELEVQKGLKHLMKDKTVFVIAHRLSTIQNADKIFVLDGGKILESGTHDELLNKRAAYFNYHQLQS